MKSKKNLFVIIVTFSLSICLIISIGVRLSISKFEYNDIFNLSNTMTYYPYTEIEYSSGSFKDVSSVKDTNSLYKFIVKGKTTSHREVLSGAVLTEITVLDVLKGNIDSKNIYIYEPIAIHNNNNVAMLSTFEGYNFIKDDKTYIFCLNELEKKYYNIYTKGKKNIFMYSTPFYGKFPLKYNSNDFAIIDEKEFTTEPFKIYKNFINYEQIFSSPRAKNKYFEEYNRLIKLAKQK
ncbi:hypothetical protein [Clostridium brassicae]|uniref:DUF4825 domain-containing protein n=1 Tax=Clostridium brassicae TaxID=2999072 RepID=A0ABT4DBH9_9CLOT|nr:hypothetical protein [Clostridium brassicae]MCY6959657.1 hypothetical protein [Clostridium brassicae]